MLTLEDDIDVHALARQGWSVSAIARHTGSSNLAGLAGFYVGDVKGP